MKYSMLLRGPDIRMELVPFGEGSVLYYAGKFSNPQSSYGLMSVEFVCDYTAWKTYGFITMAEDLPKSMAAIPLDLLMLSDTPGGDYKSLGVITGLVFSREPTKGAPMGFGSSGVVLPWRRVEVEGGDCTESD
jgi:hypothetical protein